MKFKNFIIPFLVIGTVGTLLHFVYEWSGYNSIAAVFAPINESVWEHLKMVFFPALVWCAVSFALNPERKLIEISAAAVSIFAALSSIVILFYSYSGILGFNLMAADISLFFIAVAVFILVRSIMIKKIIYTDIAAAVFSGVFLLVCAAAFIVFSFRPPQLGIFIPPQ